MDRTSKIFLIAFLVLAISLLHYVTDQSLHHFHVFIAGLYFLPIILSGFWFGLRGALAASLGVMFCYLPFIYRHWENFSASDFERILSVLLYNAAAVVVGIMRDREIRIQQQLIRSENLAAMGRSLAAVAHDMKTPVVVIGGLARRLQKRFAEGDRDREKSTLIIRETERLEKMMHNMLDFSRPLALQLTRADLNETVRNCLRLVEDAAQKNEINIACGLSLHPLEVSFDVLRMEQVLVNLLTNAIQASPPGETVEISTASDGENVIVDVVDSGCGIPFEHRKEVFDPFFSTKKEGTGLGLAIAKKIVEAHNGGLEILDGGNKGVAFRVKVPRQPTEQKKACNS